MVCFLTPSLLDHIMPASYAFHAFLHTIIMVYCCVSGDLCSYDSGVSQFLELGVSELCSTVPNSHVKPKVNFRVLSQNSQRGEILRFNFINHLVGFIPCQICLYFSN